MQAGLEALSCEKRALLIPDSCNRKALWIFYLASQLWPRFPCGSVGSSPCISLPNPGCTGGPRPPRLLLHLSPHTAGPQSASPGGRSKSMRRKDFNYLVYCPNQFSVLETIGLFSYWKTACVPPALKGPDQEEKALRLQKGSPHTTFLILGLHCFSQHHKCLPVWQSPFVA